MKTKTSKQYFNTGFIAGLAAGILASIIMLILSTTLNGISLPDVFGSKFTALMTPSMFDYLHRTIGGDAKHYFFYGILVGQCLVFALSGGLYSLIYFSRKKSMSVSGPPNEPLNFREKFQPYHGILLALILLLLTGFGLLPLTGAGLFGSDLALGLFNTLLSLAIVGVVFGGSYVLLYNWLTARPARLSRRAEAANDIQSINRRTLLKRGFIVAGVGLLGIAAWQFITQGTNTVQVPVARLLQKFKSKIVPPPVPNYGTILSVPFLSSEITPNNQYYIVSKNLVSDPTVDGNSWSLRVDGHVEHSFTLNYQQLLTQPMQQQYESMMCISNEVGGEYMSNALWEGVPLKDLLNRAGVKPGAMKVVFYAVDDYSDSIHLDKALEQTTLLAVRMNHETLPQGHGFPVRMLVPGIYGMKHCKWLTRIEVVTDDYQGYWQQRGWSDPAPVRLTARIDAPLLGASVSLHNTTYIAGVAFSGNKGISEVDVSVDAGQTWQVATLKQPLSPLTWVLWELPWQPAHKGDYTILARAIDMEGNVQVPFEAPPLPDGSTGYHTITVTVS